MPPPKSQPNLLNFRKALSCNLRISLLTIRDGANQFNLLQNGRYNLNLPLENGLLNVDIQLEPPRRLSNCYY